MRAVAQHPPSPNEHDIEGAPISVPRTNRSLRFSRRSICVVLVAFGLLPTGSRLGWAGQEPSAPTTVVVYGDSQAQGLAASLRAGVRGGGLRLINRTKPATALSQPAAYDWVAAVRQSVAADHPAIALMMFGGNDRVPARLADGGNLPFRTEAWLAYYRERLHQLISILTEAGANIVWCGNPNTRDKRYADDMAYLNELYRQALPPTGAVFVDITDVAAGPAGTYVSHGPGPDGVVQRLRTDDGIHFTAAGYDLVATRVLKAINGLAQPTAAVPASGEPPASSPVQRGNP